MKSKRRQHWSTARPGWMGRPDRPRPERAIRLLHLGAALGSRTGAALR